MHASDENDTVRSSVLEVLGEVVHAFKEDRDGPPAEILNLFLGDPSEWSSRSGSRIWAGNGFFNSTSQQSQSGRHTPKPVKNPHDKWTDPSRELTCAFNFPAVVLTLGASRWSELRGFYMHLSQSKVHKVRRTIAASIGEVAKIIGPSNASDDLLHVWRASVRSMDTADGDVRLKAVSALPALLQALSDEDRQDVADELEEIWTERLIGWRERECVAASLHELASLVKSRHRVVWALFLRALRDTISAVREAAIAVVSVHRTTLVAAVDSIRSCQDTFRPSIRSYRRHEVS